MGGMSSLEMNATVDEAAAQLEKDWNIKPVRIIEGAFVTAMNMPGMSITLLNVSQVAKRTGLTSKKILDLLDAPHGALAYPNGCVWQGHPELEKRTFAEKCIEAPKDHDKAEANGTSSSLKGSHFLSVVVEKGKLADLTVILQLTPRPCKPFCALALKQPLPLSLT